MNEIQLAGNFTLPLEAATETFALLAIRGAGKTNASQVMANEFLKNGIPFVVLDPVGVWWGLRLLADGSPNPNANILILGGEHGDLPLELEMATRLGEIVAEYGASLVLDLSLFSKNKRTQFVTAFIETLYHRNRSALHVFLEEADQFIPQKPLPDQARMIGAVDDMVRLGRNRGIGVTLISQRAAVINKNVLTQCGTLIALRTIGKHDRDAIEDWIEANGTPEQQREMMASLASLANGEAWVWSPVWLNVFNRVQIRKRETFDSSATPKVGERRIAPALAQLDTDWLAQALGAPTKAEAASGSDGLHKEIARLSKLLSEKPKEIRVEVPVLPDAEIDRLTDLAGELMTLAREILEAIAHVKAPAPRATIAATVAPVLPKRTTETVEQGGDLKLRAGERRILEMLARRYPTRLTRTQAGTLSGFTASGGTFGTYFGALKRNNLISEDSSGVLITPEGVHELGLKERPAPQTQQEVIAMWSEALRAGERAMLDVLIRQYPRGLTRDELGEATGFTASGGTFGTYLGTLRRNGLADQRDGLIYAGKALFLEQAS